MPFLGRAKVASSLHKPLKLPSFKHPDNDSNPTAPLKSLPHTRLTKISNVFTSKFVGTLRRRSCIVGGCSGRSPAHRNMDHKVTEGLYRPGACSSYTTKLPWTLCRPSFVGLDGYQHMLTQSQGFYDPVNEKMFEPPLTGFSYSFTDDGFYEVAYYRAGSNRTL